MTACSPVRAWVLWRVGIWVIYMSLYSGWRSQFAALQGGVGMAAEAVDEALQIILMTTERVARWFSTALCFISIATVL